MNNATFFVYVPTSYQPVVTRDRSQIDDAFKLGKLFSELDVWHVENYEAYPKKDAQGWAKFSDLPGWTNPSWDQLRSFLNKSGVMGNGPIQRLKSIIHQHPFWDC